MTEAPKPNPFNPAALRLGQDFSESAGVKKLLTTILIGKPNPPDFVRVNPDLHLSPVGIIEIKDDNETFLVTPDMAEELPKEVRRAALFLAVNRQGVYRIWPVKLPGRDGRHNEWNRSAAEAANTAMTSWVRVNSNMSLGAYETFQATAELPEPTWPELTFEEILQIAFRDHIIDSPDHPLVQRLRGQI